MSTEANATDAVVAMAFTIAPVHLAWVNAEAKRQAANVRPNRSAVIRALIEKAMRESETKGEEA